MTDPKKKSADMSNKWSSSVLVALKGFFLYGNVMEQTEEEPLMVKERVFFSPLLTTHAERP